MTGPGPGKISVKAKVTLKVEGLAIPLRPCSVYIHVKGYSRARVTHIDIESAKANEILREGEGVYVTILHFKGGFAVRPRARLYVNGRRLAELTVKWEGPELVRPGGSSVGFMGGKADGIYLGLKRELIAKLEGYAKGLGVPPL